RIFFNSNLASFDTHPARGRVLRPAEPRTGRAARGNYFEGGSRGVNGPIESGYPIVPRDDDQRLVDLALAERDTPGETSPKLDAGVATDSPRRVRRSGARHPRGEFGEFARRSADPLRDRVRRGPARRRRRIVQRRHELVEQRAGNGGRARQDDPGARIDPLSMLANGGRKGEIRAAVRSHQPLPCLATIGIGPAERG